MTEYLMEWYEAYVASPEQDKHQVFADLTGMSRIEAKQMCYKIAYTVSKSEVIKVYYEEKQL